MPTLKKSKDSKRRAPSDAMAGRRRTRPRGVEGSESLRQGLRFFHLSRIFEPTVQGWMERLIQESLGRGREAATLLTLECCP